MPNGNEMPAVAGMYKECENALGMLGMSPAGDCDGTVELDSTGVQLLVSTVYLHGYREGAKHHPIKAKREA